MDEALLAREYRSRILYFALKHLRDRAAAEEITHETILIVIQSLREKRVRDETKLGGYIFGVAKNLILRHQSARAREVGGADAGDNPASLWATHPEAEFLLQEQHSIVRQALDQLGALDREILHHSFVSGDRLEDIAQKLGIPYAAARKRKSRAVDRLRKIFEKLSQGNKS